MQTGGDAEADSSIPQSTSDGYEFYPDYAYLASPTWYKWVKLSCADIALLRDERGRSGLKHLFFYKNHPIQHVSVVGPIVAIEDLFGRFALLTLDDSSGATIAVKVTRRPAQAAVNQTSNTEVSNVSIVSAIGVFEVVVDGTNLDIGTVLRAKGTISKFRGANQLNLKGVSVIKTTKREVFAWDEIARWKKIISTPWKLTTDQLRDLEKKHDKKRDLEVGKTMERNQKAVKRRAVEQKQRASAEHKRIHEEYTMNQGALV